MTFELWPLFFAGVGYLALLFLVAYAAEREWVPHSLTRHPLTYTLSLGVFASSWSFYGSVGFAQAFGYNFLTTYLGVTLAFLLAPVMLQPILRLTREYQLSSLADLFAFRYRSQWAGVLVTLFMLAGTLPYFALQVRAVTESLQVLTGESAPDLIAFGFCVTILVFAVLFGARHSSAREKHEGLVLAIAFESVVKLVALLLVGLFAVFGVFGGLGGLEAWLAANPQALDAMYRPVHEGPWATLLLLAFAASFLLPRQFHMAFSENLDPRSLARASWAFPLFLLLLNLAIPPILWAGAVSSPGLSPDYYVLGIALSSGSAWLPVFTFIGGVSAASAMLIVASLALSAMCMNHLVLPASFPPRLGPDTDIYRWLLWGRRVLIALIILAGYGFYRLLEHNQGLVQLGLISFVAAAQFLPGIVGLLYWRRATRAGFVTGLLAGGALWAFALLVPLLQRSGFLIWDVDPIALLGGTAEQPWEAATFWSLSLNALLFVGTSLLTRQNAAESEAAFACCRESLTPPGGVLVAESPAQIRDQLARITGREMAEHEVASALADLGLAVNENRPAALRQVRERIERNLSGLVGPVLARMIVDERLQFDPLARTALADSIRFIEQRLEDSQTRLQGLAGELDRLRRYHRQVLHDLPLGVCSVGPAQEVVSWNQAMTQLSGMASASVIGTPLDDLPDPWAGLLNSFQHAHDDHLRKVQVRLGDRTHVLSLHKAAIEAPHESHEDQPGGTVILVEDLTDLHVLEVELAHSDRLASIGRLAAGVAHEIGNPVTGIASLAQNVLMEPDNVELVEESLELILEQTRRISNIVRSLVSFSHGGSATDHLPAPVSLRVVVDEAIRLVQLSRAGKELVFRNQCDAGHEVFGDHQRLCQVFVNLLTNAADGSSPGDTVNVISQQKNDFLEIRVIDHGNGIDEEYLDRVFEPFFTTKQPGEGTGLGLALVYNIVQEHSGAISIQSAKGEGTRVTLKLPCTLDEITQGRIGPQKNLA
ncbi:MAG: ATP-binding protein [Gammaproteobacteria bacterium]|nr:ATP-binding protein [Gammaproteobacteria bacterium]